MKHAVSKAEPAKKIASVRKVPPVVIARKEAEAKKISSVKSAKAAQENKSGALAQNSKPKAKKAQSVVVAKSNAETSKVISPFLNRKASKIVLPLFDSKNLSENKIALKVSAQTLKPKIKKTAPISAANQKVKSRKVEAIVSKPKSELRKAKTAPVTEAQKVKLQTKKAKAGELAVESQSKYSKIKPVIAVDRNKVIKKRINSECVMPADKREKEKFTVAPQKAETKVKAIEESLNQTIEKISAPRKAKPKKTKPIGAAVFRGRRERYDFQVYALDTEFENIPAIYVISKRKTDKNKRAHHALVCIGQTDSVPSELKKHTKSRCVAKHQANVISILPEANEKRRLKIEEDLRAAHAIACRIA